MHKMFIAQASTMLLIAALILSLPGCGLVALPLRVTGAAVQVVPVAGDVAAAPLEAAADVID